MSYAIYIVAILINTLLAYVIIIASGRFLDLLVSGTKGSLIYRLSILIALMEISNILIKSVYSYIFTFIQTRTVYECSRDIYQKLIRQPIDYIKKQDMAYMSQRINVDANICITFFLDTYIRLYLSILALIVSLLITVETIGVKLATIVSALMFMYILVYILFKDLIYKSAKDYRERTSIFFGGYFEALSNISFAKNHAKESLYLTRLEEVFKELFRSVLLYRGVVLSANACGEAISVVVTIIVYIICGISIIHGELTIGIFIIVLNLLGGIVDSTKFLLEYGRQYQDAKASYDRIEAIMQRDEIAEGGIYLKSIDNIKFDKVSFGYNKSLINDFSMYFEKGHVYYLVGENGAGKSTIINILIGNYINEIGGNIYYNDINIKKINMKSVREQLIGFSEQETVLVTGTIKDNLMLFATSDNQMVKYIELLKLYRGESNFGLTNDTVINVQQNNLSGGEKQKISIIRQLLQDPDVLIFDEPIANLELETKIIFAEIIQSIKKNKTIIIATHDMDIINSEDIVIKL